MTIPRCYYLLLFMLFIRCSQVAENKGGLTLLDQSITGIDFTNRIEKSYHGLTVVDYLYYYNGGGVATGDINNDGLEDIYLVANHGSNKLYLNLGNMRFRDITDSAGVAGFSQWDTGVVMSDINNDGWLDIYVSAISNFKGIEGANELYINNGDNTFSERAADFGLDYSGFVTQSAFLDFDHDGDLDCYMLTHAAHNARSYDRVMGAYLTDNSAVDRFYRNEDGFFKLSTREVNLDTLARAYNLGIAINDFNNDGWDDIYTTSDFYEDDRYYVNTGQKNFTEKGKTSFDYFSRYARGVDAGDLDHDGWQDLMSVDIRPETHRFAQQAHVEDTWKDFIYKRIYGYHTQFTRNTLQKNLETEFVDVAAFAGVHATGWNASVLLADIDDDGDKDIFTTGGAPENLVDQDYLEYAHRDSMRYAITLGTRHVNRAIEMMQPVPARPKLFMNHGELVFNESLLGDGYDFSAGAAYSDLDLDGDLDIVVNNINSPATIYQNENEQGTSQAFLNVRLRGEKNRFGLGAKVAVVANGYKQIQYITPVHGFMSSSTTIAHFGLGSASIIDSVMVTWPGGRQQVITSVKPNQYLTLEEQNSRETNTLRSSESLVSEFITLPWKHRENEYYDFYREPTIPFLLSREGPALAVGDVDGDKREDIFVGGAKFSPAAFFIQQADGSFVTHAPSAFHRDDRFEDIDAALVDIDGDEDLDLYVAAGGAEFQDGQPELSDRIYRNDGKGNFVAPENLPLYFNKACIRPADYDADGDIDFFVGGRMKANAYGSAPHCVLLKNEEGTWKADTILGEFTEAGMVTDAQWADVDNDRDLDLIVVGEWMPVQLYYNTNGKLVLFSQGVFQDGAAHMNGLWQSVLPVDYDRDGDVDIIAGNLGLNHVFPKDRALRLYRLATPSKSFTLACLQRDDGKYYPMANYQEWRQQVPEQSLISTARQYADMPIDQLAASINYRVASYQAVNQFASIALHNNGKGNFSIHVLPSTAQLSTIFTLTKVEEKGELPLIVAAGNNRGVSPVQGAYMANRGVSLRWKDGKLIETTGVRFARGEVRAVQKIRIGARDALVVACNNDSLRIYPYANNPLP